MMLMILKNALWRLRMMKDGRWVLHQDGNGDDSKLNMVFEQ